MHSIFYAHSKNQKLKMFFIFFRRMREEHFKAKEDEIRRRDSSPRDSLPKGKTQKRFHSIT